MYSESRSFISDVLTDPVEGVLDCRWSKTLDKLLENIDRENKYLSECTSGLYQALQELENKTAAEGKILHFIFLTRQGVPVYWLLKGIYAKQGKKMPDSDILGINGGYKTNEIKFDSDHETGLKSLLRVDEEKHTQRLY